MATTQYTINTLPVEVYLRGCVGYSVSDEALMTILIKRQVDFGTPVTSIEKQTLELCTADLYMWCASNPSSSSVIEDADAGWKHREGGSQKSGTDTARLISMANSIYKKYGEVQSGSTIRMNSFGMKLW